jgi:hypothetical protein
MKPLSEQLLELSQRTKRAEDVMASAQAKNRVELESQRAEIDKSIKAGKATVDARENQMKSRWDETRRGVEQRVATLRADAEARRAERGAKKAERRAEDAEQEAADMVDFALYVLDEAEFAVIDAAVARADADELAHHG